MFGFVSGQITVTGTVTDISDMGGGMPLIGGNVVVKGTTNGTATDFDGKYSIVVPDEDAVLVFSFIGLETQEITVGDRTVIDVAMDVSTTKVKEVVKMGYLVQKKEDATAAITSVGGDEINEKPTLGVDKALQGKAAGVKVISNSGSPGSGVKVQIRGMTSLSGADPLYVVDGIPRSTIEDLNPGDIESINILKDASATALYGARGAAGVVVITTKGGSKFSRKSCDESFTVKVDGFYGIQQAWRLPELTTGEEWIDIVNREEYLETGDSIITENYKDSIVSTDWLKEVFRKAAIQKYQIALEGQSEKSTYAVSGSMFKQEGIVKGSDYRRFTGRFKSSHRLGERFTVGDNIGFNTTKENQIDQGDIWTGVLPNAMVFDPTVPVYDETGNWSAGRVYKGYSADDSSTYQYAKDYKNPVGIIETQNDVTKGYGFGGSLWLNVDIVKGLSFRTTGNAGMWGNERRQYTPVYNISASQSSSRSSLKVTEQTGRNWTNNNILTYSLDVMKKDSSGVAHAFTFMAGNEYLYEYDQTIVTQTNDVPEEEDMHYLIAGTDGVVDIGAWQAPKEHTMASYLGRFEYTLLNKYLFNATVRRDGSSNFGKDYRWGTFPAVGLGWKIHEEKFIKNNESLKFISGLKLRGGWGRIGNERIGAYGYTANMVRDQNSRYNFDGKIVTTANLQALPNKDIHWEETETTNLGIDLSLWKNKLTASAEIYRKLTYDMLIQEPQPAVVGVDGASNNPESNAGEMKNIGSEYSIRYRASEREFKYEIGANISFNSNEVTKLGVGDDNAITGGPLDQPGWDISRTDVGRSVAEFYGYKTDGVYGSWAEVNEGSDPEARPGSVRFVDLNGDGQITDADRTYIGSPHADFSYGFDLGCGYKGIDFSMSWSGVYGNELFNAMNYYNKGGNFYSNRSKERIDVWTEDNAIDVSNRNKDYLKRPSDLYVEDGSYLRLKTIVLGYTLPSKITQKVKIEKFRLYVTAENLLTFTKYSGLDPEIGENEALSYNGPELGIDRGVYPQPTIYSFGFNLTF